MEQLKKALMITGLINFLLLVVSFAAPIVFLAFFAACALELFIGLLLLIDQSTRPRGQAMMIAGGIGLLIGFSVCSTMQF